MILVRNFLIVLGLSIVTGCAFNPSRTFIFKDGDIDGTFSLKDHPSNMIYVEKDEVISLHVDAAFFAGLDERAVTRDGKSGLREIFVYAAVYRDGYFQYYSVITNKAEHVCNYCRVPIHNPTFFTESIDKSYTVVIKAFEIDSGTLTKLLRRVEKTDIDSIEFGRYAPGETAVAGFKDIVNGAFNVVSSLTGRSVAQWSLLIDADPIMEHEIVITPGHVATDVSPDPITRVMIIGGGAYQEDDGLFVVNPRNLLSQIGDNEEQIQEHIETVVAGIEEVNPTKNSIRDGKLKFGNGRLKKDGEVVACSTGEAKKMNAKGNAFDGKRITFEDGSNVVLVGDTKISRAGDVLSFSQNTKIDPGESKITLGSDTQVILNSDGGAVVKSDTANVLDAGSSVTLKKDSILKYTVNGELVLVSDSMILTTDGKQENLPKDSIVTLQEGIQVRIVANTIGKLIDLWDIKFDKDTIVKTQGGRSVILDGEADLTLTAEARINLAGGVPRSSCSTTYAPYIIISKTTLEPVNGDK